MTTTPRTNANDDSDECSQEIHGPIHFPTPRCYRLAESDGVGTLRDKLNTFLRENPEDESSEILQSPLAKYLRLGLACTAGSALGELPPSDEDCFRAFLVPNCVGLTMGARAWTKHAHRSGNSQGGVASESSWWGQPKGSLSVINEKATALFEKIMSNVTWRNLHWLPHQIIVYEVRVEEGYGMRWCKDKSQSSDNEDCAPWQFRGFVEPMMEDGHEVGWRH